MAPRGGGGSRRAAPSALAVVALLALALWVASTLGLVHRTLHPPVRVAAAAFIVAPAGAEAGIAAPTTARQTLHAGKGHGLAGLFAPHGESDCRLYDQLAGAAAMPSVPFVLLPVVLPMARFHYFLGEALARWVALFDARGPPATR